MAKTILIVEDEKTLFEALSVKLEEAGYKIVEAKDGKEGLEIALKIKPDLLLVDILMPIMDGITMINKLKEDEWGKNVPMIILTNFSDEEKMRQAELAGVHDYMVKSDWKLSDLVDKVNEKLKG